MTFVRRVLVREGTEMHTKFWSVNLNERSHFEKTRENYETKPAVRVISDDVGYKPVARSCELTQSFWPQYGCGVDSGSNRNEYQEYFLGGEG